MLPTVLRRWSCCYSYFCVAAVFAAGRFMLSLALLFVLVFFSPFIIVITSLGEERSGLFVSRVIVCLFCTRLILYFFSSSWCHGLAATSACDTPWNLTFFISGYPILSAHPFDINCPT